MTYDPTRVWLFHELLTAIPEEMGQVLERTGYSPNIKERRDYSCALFDHQGRLLAQAAHIPVHLGAMPALMDYLLPRFEWEPGDMILTNDPYSMGTHLPDWTLVAPVYVKGQCVGFVANRAHHADIGGAAPGSMPLAREVFEEGIRIPPAKFVRRGEVNPELLDLLLANVRTPQERRGDLLAQMGANRVGITRFERLFEGESKETWWSRFESLFHYSEQVMRSVLRSIPPGEYRFEDYLDDDGRGHAHIPIRVRVEVPASGEGESGRVGKWEGNRSPEALSPKPLSSRGGEILFDFTGSAPQCEGGINATEAVTRAACYYVVRCLAPMTMPTNAGCWRPVQVIAPPGTVVNAQYPAAVAGGNVETSQRIVDVLLGALAQALPDRIPAASQGTMNNLLFGGKDPFRGRAFAYYETIGGGCGACPDRDGASGLHSHMTNTRNTPIEALETAYPVRVLEYRFAEGTGGRGKHRGGNGVQRTFQFLCEATVTLFSERRRFAPYGLEGGQPGKKGRNRLLIEGQPEKELHKETLHCPPGTVLSIQTPGGGGWGTPEK